MKTYHYIYITHMRKQKASSYVHYKKDVFEAMEFINNSNLTIKQTLTGGAGDVTGFILEEEKRKIDMNQLVFK